MDTVRDERWRYIGGSDIAAIMGISPFKTRFQLLQEKAQIIEPDFKGNEYTEYGNVMEPKIRDYVNETLGRNFAPDVLMNGVFRFNLDGLDKECCEVLEIKTTSQIHGKLEDYKVYLVQLLPYMRMAGAVRGFLAVYQRPDDFDETFNPLLLTVYEVHIDDYSDLLEEIDTQVEMFKKDLEKLRENPFITEEELQPKEVVEYANKVLALEQQLESMKQLEKELKSAKAELKRLMQENDVKKWITPNGTKITLVPDGEDTIVSAFNEKKFAEEKPDIYAEYLEEKLKAGRSGYVRVTLPKEI